MKKIFVIIFFSFSFCLIAQETEIPKSANTATTEQKTENSAKTESPATKNEIDNKTKNDKNEEANSFEEKKSSDFGFYFGLNLMLSDTGKAVNPPLGVSMNLGIEYEYAPPVKYMILLPSLDASIFHYGFSKALKREYICEVENRTALTFAFLLDFPVMGKFNIKSWSLSFGGGLAFLIRGGLLEPGIKADDTNDEDLTSKEELKRINVAFWKNARFLYPSVNFKADYSFESGWQTGLKFKMLLPLANLWDKPKRSFVDSMLFQLSIILHPPKLKQKQR